MFQCMKGGEVLLWGNLAHTNVVVGKRADDILQTSDSVRHDICDNRQNRQKAFNTPQG